MGRINSWLIRRLDKLPDPAPLPPKLEQLRLTIERRMSRVVCLTILAVGGYSIASQVLLNFWFGVIILIPVVFFSLLGVTVAASYQSQAAVREYVRWLRGQPPVPSRVMRMGIPYQRQAPVATIHCLDCPAVPGQRHSRSCPSVPPEWFKK